MVFNKDKEKKITRIRLWKFEFQFQESEKVYFGNWKWGEKLVGSFTLIK